MLTIKQAEVIYELSNQGFADGIPFAAIDAFPGLNNKDSSCRRVLKNLGKQGIVKMELPGQILDVEVLDHLVIGAEKWVSLKDFRPDVWR